MLIVVWFFFFKQKTAYEWRISDWSSDVCSSDLRPDAILILGDTNSALAAIPAKRRRITIFHMEAGNRCFDQRVPEEINRVIVDHIADMNQTYSDIAREMRDRQSVWEGMRVSVRGDLTGDRNNKKQQ